MENDRPTPLERLAAARRARDRADVAFDQAMLMAEIDRLREDEAVAPAPAPRRRLRWVPEQAL